MCGRFAFSPDKKIIEEEFGLSEFPGYTPRFNCAPSQALAVIPNSNRLPVFFRWGLIPFWTRQEKPLLNLINTRAESIRDKTGFRQIFKKRRCLVPADSFYEWKVVNGKKKPFRIRVEDRIIFSMAGLWDQWQDPTGLSISSFSIITTQANSFMKDIHHRMPVILKRENYVEWLGSDYHENLYDLLAPYSGTLSAVQVSDSINVPANDFPEAAMPV